MPKDRLARLGSTLAVALTLGVPAAGCRNTRPEVPPERPFPGAAAAAGPAPRVAFSTEPPPGGNALGTNLYHAAPGKTATDATVANTRRQLNPLAFGSMREYSVSSRPDVTTLMSRAIPPNGGGETQTSRSRSALATASVCSSMALSMP